MSGGVLCAGRLYCDLVFQGLGRMPSLGTEVFAEGLSLHPGGGAALTGAYLAALGVPVSLLATLPAAPFDGPVTETLDAAGLDLSLCPNAPKGADPQITVAMPLGEDRAFLTRTDGPALPRIDGGGLRTLKVQHLHIGELRTLAEHPWLVAAAREAGMTVSLDCGWDDAMGAEALGLIAQVDVFLPNRAETEALERLGMVDCPAPVTVIKRGAEGAEALTRQGSVRVPAHKAEVVDSTGAGDAFNGGFLARWLEGASLRRCVEEGVRCGAAAVAAPGGLSGAAALRKAEAPAEQVHG
ncbi:carbohydrate kinase family protein [Dinoroseobacter sp. S375]|uniref:carbohydrate kinase family protein n=1 Tax=Dinoroseobacter sp. S375 TaxID=3415136 RepID=UPI003C7C8DDB